MLSPVLDIRDQFDIFEGYTTFYPGDNITFTFENGNSAWSRTVACDLLLSCQHWTADYRRSLLQLLRLGPLPSIAQPRYCANRLRLSTIYIGRFFGREFHDRDPRHRLHGKMPPIQIIRM